MCCVLFPGQEIPEGRGKNNQTSGFQILPHTNPDYDAKSLQGLASFHFYEVKGLEGENHKLSGHGRLSYRKDLGFKLITTLIRKFYTYH